jgi:hypothetical protein
MISWIKEYIGIKNLFILITVVFVIAGLLLSPSLYRKLLVMQYEGITKAKVTNIVTKKTFTQHINGTNEIIIGYDISYNYTNQNKIYSQTEFIMADEKVKQLFDKIASGETCFIEVKYSLDIPCKSTISKLNLNY